MPIDVEVMIVSYGSAADVEACLTSIASAAPTARVALREHGDAAAYEQLLDVAQAASVPTRVEHDPANPGFGAGCNALADASTAAWFLFLNPDARLVSWPWETEPIEPPAVVGPVYTAADDHHRGRTYRIRDEVGRSWFRRSGPPPDGRGFVSGAALLIDAATFRRIEGFDTAHFMFYEDIDLCLRANEVGTTTTIEPAWQVEHARGHSTGERFGDALMWSYESGCRFHAAQGSPVWTYRAYVAVDAVMRAGLHGVRRDGRRGRAYVGLAKRAFSDCVRRGRSRP
ncbi:MAG: glycosyltransferase family 2 protein [Ilumatobacter sp.]|nr:glycosyltransferase family 2 protein [Ilumatobacter sp.]